MPRRVCLLIATLTCSGIAVAHPQAASAPPTVWLDLRPADSLTSGGIVAGSLLRRLPIDDPRQAFTLVPGVSVRGGEIGIAVTPQLSIRGSALSQPGIYVDGAPVRVQTLGDAGIGLAANAIAHASVTAGVAPTAVADAAGGVVAYETRSGGDRIEGGVRWDSDEPFGAGSSVGYNRIEGAAGGPLGTRIRVFVSATVQGQRSSYRGLGAEGVPIYMPSGVDTVVTATFGRDVTVPRFVQWSGACDPGSNAGVECQGLRRPFDWSSARRVQGKVAYHYGSGSILSLTGLGGDLQQRFFPGPLTLNPALYQGRRATSAIGIVNWRHVVAGAGAGSVAAYVNLAFARESDVAGPLEAGVEVETRDPYLGVAFEALRFTGLDILSLPVTDQLVRNIRTNSGLRTPYLEFPLALGQSFRNNPYGMQSGWPNMGLDGLLSAMHERRTYGRAGLEWVIGIHQMGVGLEVERATVSLYRSSLIRQTFMNVFLAHPRRTGFFVSDQVALGAGAVLEIGARYDRYAPGGEFPTVPGRISTHPAWNPDAATSDTAYVRSVARVFQRVSSQSFLSPRLRFALALTDKASIRLGYSRAVELPAWETLFRGSNSDLAFTSTFDAFGRDVRFATTSLVDVGARVALPSGLALDLSLFRKDLPQYVFRILPFADPRSPTDTLSINALTTSDGNSWGGEGKLDWRVGEWLAASAAYGLGRIHTNPGPFGFPSQDVTSHTVTAAVVVRAPGNWSATPGGVLRTLSRDLAAVVVIRGSSGLPYTRLINEGAGTITPGLSGRVAESLNASRLPWTKRLDLRLTKSVLVGGRTWEVFADVRNVLNFRNAIALFAETGGVVNESHRNDLLQPEYDGLNAEAGNNSALEADGTTINLRSCGTWSRPENCVALTRVEGRFGDGDGLYALTEQQRALNAYYDAFFGSWRFYGSGRTVRVGAELKL